MVVAAVAAPGETGLALFGEESQVEQAGIEREIPRIKPGLSEEVAMNALRAQISFHSQEVEEGPRRTPPMQAEQVGLHEQQLESFQATLGDMATSGSDAEIIPINPDRPV